MKAIRSFLGKTYWIYLLISAIFLAGCGTFEVGLEPTSSPEAATAMPFLTPTLHPGTLSPPATATPTPAPLPQTVVTREADLEQKFMTVTGRAMSIDPPTGIMVLIPETETPFAESDGQLPVRISEWAHIVDMEGEIVSLGEFSRGIKLELKLQFRDGQLTSEEVLVLERGVPRPEENPAYTDVSGLVTPLAETPQTGDGAIQLFTVAGAAETADPGSPITLKWSFNGESGAICVDQLPRPVTPTCYQELPPAGSIPVIVPEDAREAIIYSLYVQLDGEVESADLRLPLSAGLGCDYEWFFESERLLGCPAREAAAVRPQAQTFERGLMLRVEDSWLGSEPYLFTFIWDEERQEYGFTEGPIQDTWTADMAEQVIGEEPPGGLLRPSRGFGLLWSGQVEIPAMGEARTLDGLNLIGWANGPVQQYDAQYQCAEALFGNQICYLSLPDGQVVGMPGEA